MKKYKFRIFLFTLEFIFFIVLASILFNTFQHRKDLLLCVKTIPFAFVSILPDELRNNSVSHLALIICWAAYFSFLYGLFSFAAKMKYLFIRLLGNVAVLGMAGYAYIYCHTQTLRHIEYLLTIQAMVN